MSQRVNSKRNNKGFTLAEMLIVVAIIGVLTATAVPIFSSVNERAKEATDLANIRAAYAEVMVEVVVDQSTTHSAIVTMVQTKADWQTDDVEATLQRLAPGHIEGAPSGEKGAQTTVQWNAAGYLEIIFDGEGSGEGGTPAPEYLYDSIPNLGTGLAKAVNKALLYISEQGEPLGSKQKGTETSVYTLNIGSYFSQKTAGKKQLLMNTILQNECGYDTSQYTGAQIKLMNVYLDKDGQITAFSYDDNKSITYYSSETGEAIDKYVKASNTYYDAAGNVIEGGSSYSSDPTEHVSRDIMHLPTE